MSYNQSRFDRGDTQSRRPGRSAGYHHQQQRSSSGGYGKGGGVATAPAPPNSVDSSVSSASSLSSNRSYKKAINAQGGQPQVNFPPDNRSVPKDASLPPNNQNGSNALFRSQGASGEPVTGGATNPTESFSSSRSSRAIPKAPSSQSTTITSKSNERAIPSTASGDTSKPCPFQFGSLGPDLMKIPARTSSAPPNLDEQKRAQTHMHQSTAGPAPDLPTTTSKQDPPSTAVNSHSVRRETTSREKRDAQAAHIPNQTQKSPVVPMWMPTTYQYPQVPHPVHFGGPSIHMQPQNVAPNSFQMPMPMALSMGSTPQNQQAVFLPGLQSHPMAAPPHHGTMHQAHGSGFAAPVGAQLHPQMGHMGVGVSPQYPLQQAGNFYGPRKTPAVKITHPETRKEICFDRRGDSDNLKSHPNTPPRSQPVSSTVPRPVNVQSSYNAVLHPPVSQAPTCSLPVSQGSQCVQFIKPTSQSATTKVTVKPASQSLRSSGEVGVSYPQKTADTASTGPSEQPKADYAAGATIPSALSGENTPLIAKTESKREETVGESNSIDKKTPAHPSMLTSERSDAVLREEPVEISSTCDASASDVPCSDVDKLTEGSTHVTTETCGSLPQDEVLHLDGRGSDVGGDRSVSEKPAEGSEVSAEQLNSESVPPRTITDQPADLNTSSNGITEGEGDSADFTGNTSSVLSRSTDLQSSSAEKTDDGLLASVSVAVTKEKSAVESNTMRNITSKGKKKRKDVLKKADAVGTSDLYMAYKGPEEKKETTTPLESRGEIHGSSDMKQELPHGHQVVAEAPKEVEQIKNEPEDWEEVADVSTPDLETTNYSVHSERGSSDDVKDSFGNMEKKYSRDFLLKFADQCTALPDGSELVPDIADVMINATSHRERDSYGTPGKGMSRKGNASRVDRRPVNMPVDDRWMKNPGSFGSGYGGNPGFRPGQGGNAGVLGNQRVQAPIMPRPMQSVGPHGGMGRNSPDSERWQRASNFQQKGLMSYPNAPLVVMHRAEKKYEVGKVTDEEQAKQRKLKGILNKLTPQNFERLFEQVKNVNIDNIGTLKGVISQIFDKALMEPTFCEMYADFCAHLSGELPDFTENDEKITFKRLLLNKCQEEFERGEREEEEGRADDGEGKQTEEEREEQRLKTRRRMLGNIRLIGELYKKKMLTDKIMHACIQKLLGFNEDPDEEDIEALCKLMSTIGEMIDQLRAKTFMDSYFEKMRLLSNKQQLSSRVRFMLRDAIDLRKNKWQQRRKIEGPKKIEEVHRDAAQERQTQTNRLARGGPSINSSPRRGPSDFGSRGGGIMSSPGAQMGNFHGLHQARSFGHQDSRFDNRTPYEARTAAMPQRALGDESITLGPQGGLGQGMSIRRPSVASNTSISDSGDFRRTSAGVHAYVRPRSNAQEQSTSYGNRDSAGPTLVPDVSIKASAGVHGQRGASSTGNDASENVLSEDRLRDMSMATIKEFYSARDENEVGLCIKDLKSPGFHPTMISLWVTDSFERKDMERGLLAKLLVDLVKSPGGAISEAQLVKGFESVLTTLEDAVNDAPRAAEFLGRIFGKAVTEKVVALPEIGRLVREGGEEPGSLVACGLGGDVIGNALETIKSEAGEAAFAELRSNSGLRLEEFKPREPCASKILDKYM